MRRSTERIIVSHAGNLPRPDDLDQAVAAGDIARFEQLLPGAVTDVVRHQAEIGVDCVNDGELSKIGGFSAYVRDRLGGLEQRDPKPGENAAPMNVSARDRIDFPGFYEAGMGGFGRTRRVPGTATATQPVFCTGPITYIGSEATKADLDRFKAAMQGLGVEGYVPAIAPGTIEHWLQNAYYKSDEDFLFAIADAMNHEYKLIVDAGFVLQVDDPDLPDAWQVFPSMSVADYRAYAELRAEAINRALAGIPEDRVRLHVCWGSGHGPHKHDIPLRDIADIVLKVKAECYSVEAANPRHDHEWRVWQEVKLPPGKSFMPGVAGHASDIVEHPRLIADRLLRYARIMGRENVIAGTDCGLGTRVGHAEIAWAKLQATVEGARIATQELWS